MSFSNLLKQPLPSQTKMQVQESVKTDEILDEVNKFLAESAEEIMSTDDEISGLPEMEDMPSELDESCQRGESCQKDEACGNTCESDDEDEEDLDDIDISDLSDDELDDMEAELQDSDLDDVIGDDDEPVELDSDEEREADDLMALAGTTELLKSELNVEERAAFLESSIDTQIAVFEGFLLESDVRPVSEDDDIMTEAKMYNKTSIRFSKEDRKKQLYAVALNVSARAHNDADYIKLQKVQKMRRVLKRKIQKKYHNEAIKRMKVYFNRLKSSKSAVLSSLGKKVDK